MERHRTALRRNSLSRPVARALSDGLLQLGTSFFDYGCGFGGDVERLRVLGYAANGWDPAHFPNSEKMPADVVNLGYVANVVEDPVERAEALRMAWALCKRVLIVAARLDWEARWISGRIYGDGIVTGRGTFQKLFSQEELRSWIDTTLSTRSIAAAPGIFYVFRHAGDAQSFLAAGVRHRPRLIGRLRLDQNQYVANQGTLGVLLEFLTTRGRPPALCEVPNGDDIVKQFGSLRAALRIVREATDESALQAARAAGTDDLTVYLALAAFGGRPKFTDLPTDLQMDVKAFFGSYRQACLAADALLYQVGDQRAIDQACRQSLVGKLTPEALYVHVSALTRLSPLLRVYEGCGRALAGVVDGATIIKLHRLYPKVSYLSYPDFDADPHPSLATSVRADLRRLDLKYRDFRGSTNPPILHRKETFVDSDYPGRALFASLTAKEEALGLLAYPQAIGTRDGWLAFLDTRGVKIVGHDVVPAR